MAPLRENNSGVNEHELGVQAIQREDIIPWTSPRASLAAGDISDGGMLGEPSLADQPTPAIITQAHACWQYATVAASNRARAQLRTGQHARVAHRATALECAIESQHANGAQSTTAFDDACKEAAAATSSRGDQALAVLVLCPGPSVPLLPLCKRARERRRGHMGAWRGG